MSPVDAASMLIKDLIDSHNWNRRILDALIHQVDSLTKDEIVEHLNILASQSDKLSIKINTTIENCNQKFSQKNRP